MVKSFKQRGSNSQIQVAGILSVLLAYLNQPLIARICTNIIDKLVSIRVIRGKKLCDLCKLCLSKMPPCGAS